MAMRRSLASLYYPATYLLGTGAMLLLAPRLALRLCFSTRDYGDVMPRMAGALIFALGILVVQIIRHEAEALYQTVVGVRVFLCSAWIGLFVYSGDVFFLIVFGVVGAGLLWTILARRADLKAGRAAEGGRPA